MKIYFDLAKQCITDVDNENQVIFTGDTLVSTLKVISTTPTTSFYVLVSAKLSNGRTIGPFIFDEDGVTTDSTSTTWEFTMSKDNGFTMSKGLMNIYVWLCPTIQGNLNHKCLGSVVVNVGEAKEFGDNYFISVSQEDEVEVLTNMEAQIMQLQNLINSVTTIEANPVDTPSDDLFTIKIGSVTYELNNYYPKCVKLQGNNLTFADFWNANKDNNGNINTFVNYDNMLSHVTYNFSTGKLQISNFTSSTTLGGGDLFIWNSMSTSSTKKMWLLLAGDEANKSHLLQSKADKTYVDGLVNGINEKIPSGASSNNKLVTEDEITALDGRLDNIEEVMPTLEEGDTLTTKGYVDEEITQVNSDIATVDGKVDAINAKIPSDASSSNKLATADAVARINNKIPTEATSSNKLADKAYVNTQIETNINNLPKPMVFKGTLGTGGTITSLPSATAANEGFTYKVITDGTYASQGAEVGDVFVSNGSAWVLIPAGDDVEDTWRKIKLNGNEVLGNGISSGDVDFSEGVGISQHLDPNNSNKIVTSLKNVMQVSRTTSINELITLIRSFGDSLMARFYDITKNIMFTAHYNSTLLVIAFEDSVGHTTNIWSGSDLTNLDKTASITTLYNGTGATSINRLISKVDRVVGMGLSHNDFTDAYKTTVEALHYNQDDDVLTLDANVKVSGGLYIGEDEINIENELNNINNNLDELGTADTNITDTTSYKISGVTDGLALPSESQVEVVEVRGNSVVRNNQVANGNFASNSNWTNDNSINISISNNQLTGTYNQNSYEYGSSIHQSATIIAGHTYLTYVNVKAISVDAIFIRTTSDILLGDMATTGVKVGIKTATNNGDYIGFGSYGNTYENTGFTISNLFIVDLTQFFNGNVPANLTAEQFLAEYGDMIPSTQDLGTIVSSSGKLVNTGRNLWDEEWEVGDISRTTGENTTGTCIRSKDYIRVIPNTSYFVSMPTTTNVSTRILCYNANKQFVYQGDAGMLGDYQNQSFTTPADCYYIRFRLSIAYGTTYSHDIMLNYGTTALAYEPYQAHEIALPELKSVPNVAYDVIKGNKTRTNVLEVDLSTLNWTWDGSNNQFYSNEISTAKSGGWHEVICDKYEYDTRPYYQLPTTHTLGIYDKRVYIANANDSLTITGTLYCELATPTEEDYEGALYLPCFYKGTEQQTSDVPYTLTRNYDISIKDQVLTNVKVDAEQQKEIEKLKERHLYQIVLGDNDDAIMIPAFLVSNLGGADYMYSVDTDQNASDFSQTELKFLWEVGNVIRNLAPFNYFPPSRKVGDYAFGVNYNPNNNKITWYCNYSGNTLCNIEITKSGNTYTCTSKTGTGYMYFYIEKIY